MYKAFLNNQIFFDTTSMTDSLSLTSAKLSLQAGSAGSFTFTIPPGNTAYSNLHKLVDFVDVYRDNELIFSGRIYSIEEAFDTQLKVTCEGLLALLNDSVFRPVTFQGDLHDLVEDLIDSHNSQVEAEKQITIGYMFIEDSACYRAYENYETTISRIQDLVEAFGGWVQIRKANGHLYFDWYDQNRDGVDQTIDFGQNLLDIKQLEDSDGICTVLVPLGAADENNQRINIKSVNAGLDYIVADQEYVEKYGLISAVHIWDDVNYPNILKAKAAIWLDACLAPKYQINVTAVDLADAGVVIDAFRPGQVIRVRSVPHNIDDWFDCVSQNLDLLNPANNKLTLGTEKAGYIKASRSESAQIQRTFERIVAEYATKSNLEIAQEHLTDVLRGNEGGFIIERDTNQDGYIDEILIMDTTSTETARNVWRINQNGWGHSSQGIDGPYTMGATLEDAFIAKFIDAGYLNADLIKTGMIQGQGGGSWWNLNTGELHIVGQTEVDKSKVFISEPTVPYYVGDLWVTGYNRYTAVADYAVASYAVCDEIGTSTGLGVIMYCTSTKTTGSFDQDDWKVCTNYIDTDAVENLAHSIQTAEAEIDTINGQISLLATSEELDEAELRITSAEEQILGQQGQINLLAREVTTVAIKSRTFRSEPVPPYADGDTWVTGSETYTAICDDAVADEALVGWGKDIFVCTQTREDGEQFHSSDWMLATKYISDDQLNQLGNELRQRIRNANIAIDAANARIDLKADETTVYGVMTQVKDANIRIDGANANITAIASVDTSTEIGRRVQSAEASIDAQNGILLQVVDDTTITGDTEISGNKLVGFINLTSTTAKIQASQIYLTGQVKISDLDTATKNKVNSAIKSNVPVYYRKTTSGAPNAPTAAVTRSDANTSNVWTLVMPQPKQNCYFYTCEQYISEDNTVSFSAVKEISNATYTSKWVHATDTTCIDGAHIYTGTMDADAIRANSTLSNHVTATNLDITGGKISINIPTYHDISYLELIYDQYYKSYFGLLWAGFHADTYKTYWGTEYDDSTRLPTNQYITFEYNYSSTRLRSWLSSTGLIIQNGTNNNKSVTIGNQSMTIRTNGDNYSSKLEGNILTIKNGGDTRQAYLSNQTLYLVNGSRTAGIEVNNGSWNGSVVYGDYLWAKRDVLNDSDARTKKNIRYLDKNRAAEFVYSLKPAEFEFLSSPDWVHHGFITQDINSYSAWRPVVNNPAGYQSLAYTEIMADLVATIQSLNDRIKALEGR